MTKTDSDYYSGTIFLARRIMPSLLRIRTTAIRIQNPAASANMCAKATTGKFCVVSTSWTETTSCLPLLLLMLDESSSGPPSSSSDPETCRRGVSHVSSRRPPFDSRMNRDDVSLSLVPPEVLLQIFILFIGDEQTAVEKHYGVSPDSLVGKESSVPFDDDFRAERQRLRQLRRERLLRRAGLAGQAPVVYEDDSDPLVFVADEPAQFVRTCLGRLLVVSSVCKLWRHIVFRSGCEAAAAVTDDEGDALGEKKKMKYTIRNRDHPMLLLLNSVLIDSLRKRHRFRVTLLRYDRLMLSDHRQGGERRVWSCTGVSKVQFKRQRRKERRDLRRWQRRMNPAAGPGGPGPMPPAPPMCRKRSSSFHVAGSSAGLVLPPAPAAPVDTQPGPVVVDNADLHEFLRSMGVLEGLDGADPPPKRSRPWSRAARRLRRQRNRKNLELQRLQKLVTQAQRGDGEYSSSDSDDDDDDDDFGRPMWPQEEEEHQEWIAGVRKRMGISSWEDDLKRTERRIERLQNALEKVAAARAIAALSQQEEDDGEESRPAPPPAPPALIFHRLAELKRRHCDLLKEKFDPDSRYYEERIGHRYTLDEIFEVLKAEREERSSLAMILRIRAAISLWGDHIMFVLGLLIGYVCFVLLVLREERAGSVFNFSRLQVLLVVALLPTVGFILPEIGVYLCTLLDILAIRRLGRTTGCRMRDRAFITTSWTTLKQNNAGFLVIPLLSAFALFAIVPIVCFDDFDPDSVWNGWVLFIIARVVRWAAYLLAMQQATIGAGVLVMEFLRHPPLLRIVTPLISIVSGLLALAFMVSVACFLEDYWYYRPFFLVMSIIIAAICLIQSLIITSIPQLLTWWKNGVLFSVATLSSGAMLVFLGCVWAIFSILWGFRPGFARWTPLVVAGCMLCIGGTVRTVVKGQNPHAYGYTFRGVIGRVRGIPRKGDQDPRCLHDWRAYRMSYFHGLW